MRLLVIQHQIKLNLAHKDWDVLCSFMVHMRVESSLVTTPVYSLPAFFVANATQEATVIEGSQYKPFLATAGHSGLLGAEDRLCGCRASGEF